MAEKHKRCPICGKIPQNKSKKEGYYYLECCGIDTDEYRSNISAIRAFDALVNIYNEIKASLMDGDTKQEQK